MSEVIRLDEQFYVLATSSRLDDQTRVLKHGDTFAVFDRQGDLYPYGLGEQGIYHEGTRYLSRLELRLGTDRPLLLSSTVTKDNVLLTVDLMNPDVRRNNVVSVTRGMIHIFRSKLLWRGACYEQVRLTNFGISPVEFSLSCQFESDYADIFEVRGTRRARRGRLLRESVESGAVVLAYEGLDGGIRRTRLEFSPAPVRLSRNEAHFDVRLESRGEATLHFSVHCEGAAAPATPARYADAHAASAEAAKKARAADCEFYSSSDPFNEWLNRSLADLDMMITETEQGPYPYAGVPWFCTPFGRDGIITALEWLWANPEIARGVLKFLAATQARESSDEREADPGKILHEMRKGEMAALGEVPFGLYYGSVDATPLFLVLAGAYYERTADRGLIESIWPQITASIAWLDRYGDLDGDGFVEYRRRHQKGLIHQGWKDSHDAIFHADGTLAEGPIALCEVQGYVYAARLRAAQLALVFRQTDMAREQLRKARDLRDRFEEVFWCQDLSVYALALDGAKRPCRVRTSNAGHCLFSGIAGPERARLTAETLMGEEFYSGWGIRTLAATERRYNPMSYHNGSVWPHDNALIAYGMGRYGYPELSLQILTGLFEATPLTDLHRLPELFCGFSRRAGQGPTPYPVACAPQSWSAASVLLLLQSCLGLSIDAPHGKISFSRSLLPPFLQELHVKNLRVADSRVDLLFLRHAGDVNVNILRREGPLQIVVTK